MSSMIMSHTRRDGWVCASDRILWLWWSPEQLCMYTLTDDFDKRLNTTRARVHRSVTHRISPHFLLQGSPSDRHGYPVGKSVQTPWISREPSHGPKNHRIKQPVGRSLPSFGKLLELITARRSHPVCQARAKPQSMPSRFWPVWATTARARERATSTGSRPSASVLSSWQSLYSSRIFSLKLVVAIGMFKTTGYSRWRHARWSSADWCYFRPEVVAALSAITSAIAELRKTHARTRQSRVIDRDHHVMSRLDIASMAVVARLSASFHQLAQQSREKTTWCHEYFTSYHSTRLCQDSWSWSGSTSTCAVNYMYLPALQPCRPRHDIVLSLDDHWWWIFHTLQSP